MNTPTTDILQKVIQIQSWFRGNVLRLKRLPPAMYYVQRYIKSCVFEFAKNTDDGRINSCIDEDKIIALLNEKFPYRIKKPNIRMWYDLLIFDRQYGWLPVNIKTTTTTTHDNIGNLATCVYSYTDYEMDIERTKTYENGKMSIILVDKLKKMTFNQNNKRDYYFLVLNKNDPNEVIINSIKGLTILTPNINNLPFQVCWSKNKTFNYGKINLKVIMFLKCLQRPSPSWKETFMTELRTINL